MNTKRLQKIGYYLQSPYLFTVFRTYYQNKNMNKSNLITVTGIVLWVTGYIFQSLGNESELVILLGGFGLMFTFLGLYLKSN